MVLSACAAQSEAQVEPAKGGGRAVLFQALRVEESALRGSTDFSRPLDRSVHGPDPYDLARLDGGRWVGLLRGAESLVLLDDELAPIGLPVSGPPRPESVVVTGPGSFLVASGLSPKAWAFKSDRNVIVRAPEHDVAFEGMAAVRALAAGPRDCVHAAAEREDVVVSVCGKETRRTPVPSGPFRIAVAGDHLVIASLVGHALAIAPLGPDGMPASTFVPVVHDGPFFGFAVSARAGRVLVAAGGIEDTPLDRTGGFFGGVDSFVWLYTFDDGRWRRLASVNISELGVVTPKGVALRLDGGEAVVTATGYASDVAVEIRVPLEGEGGPRTRTLESVPGLTKIVEAADGRFVGPSDLLDTWVELDGGAVVTHPAPGTPPDRGEVFLGEALFSTSLIAPWQVSDGPKSRFTCEACHFEGGVDGRTHRTGRGEVRATTKPLRGLFNNTPHFTRALDDDTTEMVFAELGVAAAGSGHDGWVALDDAPIGWTKDVPWATDLDRSALGARRALLGYLAASPHPPNPRAAGRTSFDADETRGAEVFAEVCASCHAPRLVANDATTEVPRERWERMVLSEAGAIVWARDAYEKTGIEPYVHAQGARPSSLRRLEEKRPYFTNGSAKTLEDVVESARLGAGGAFFHGAAPGGSRGLTAEEQRALVAFLRLL